jgi:hypothetical protein
MPETQNRQTIIRLSTGYRKKIIIVCFPSFLPEAGELCDIQKMETILHRIDI